jgi:hypothetical protein
MTCLFFSNGKMNVMFYLCHFSEDFKQMNQYNYKNIPTLQSKPRPMGKVGYSYYSYMLCLKQCMLCYSYVRTFERTFVCTYLGKSNMEQTMHIYFVSQDALA